MGGGLGFKTALQMRDRALLLPERVHGCAHAVAGLCARNLRRRGSKEVKSETRSEERGKIHTKDTQLLNSLGI